MPTNYNANNYIWLYKKIFLVRTVTLRTQHSHHETQRPCPTQKISFSSLPIIYHAPITLYPKQNRRTFYSQSFHLCDKRRLAKVAINTSTAESSSRRSATGYTKKNFHLIERTSRAGQSMRTISEIKIKSRAEKKKNKSSCASATPLRVDDEALTLPCYRDFFVSPTLFSFFSGQSTRGLVFYPSLSSRVFL